MTKTFYLFRHGETDWNRTRRLQGAVDIPLNDRGREQAVSLRSYFAANPVDAVLSSDLSRAFETAQIAFAGTEVPFHVDARLREMNLGEAEGLMIDQVTARFGEAAFLGWTTLEMGEEPCFPNGESKAAHLRRMLEALHEFASAPQNRGHARIAVATHGGACVVSCTT